MSTSKLSVVVMTKNEEDKIEGCLRSVSFADEIVVVDSGSEDNTVEIAKSMGATVIFNKWRGHIAQRNYALDHVNCQWALCLDADERVSPKLRYEIKTALARPSADGYAVPRRVFYINRWIYHCGWYPARKIRLVKKGKARAGGENPHDRIFLDGRKAQLTCDLYHLSFDDISEHLATINSFTQIAAHHKTGIRKRSAMMGAIFRPPVMFLKMYFFKLGFLDGVPGLIVSVLSAYHVFSKYIKMWENAAR